MAALRGCQVDLLQSEETGSGRVVVQGLEPKNTFFPEGEEDERLKYYETDKLLSVMDLPLKIPELSYKGSMGSPGWWKK